MAFPIKTCVLCGDEFELRPDKPGFANRCPSCSEPQQEAPVHHGSHKMSPEERHTEIEANAMRRRAIRDMLYPRDN
ncbi:MAG TPA: hypothetical protein VL986_04730 [Terracidiphilus sp.]|nr:hypothetical protein [Terracidiphilus sp.]